MANNFPSSFWIGACRTAMGLIFQGRLWIGSLGWPSSSSQDKEVQTTRMLRLPEVLLAISLSLVRSLRSEILCLENTRRYRMRFMLDLRLVLCSMGQALMRRRKAELG